MGEPTTVKPGDIISAPEESYRYGVGALLLRVEEVMGSRQVDGEVWAEFRGYRRRPDGWQSDRLGFALVRLRSARKVGG